MTPPSTNTRAAVAAEVRAALARQGDMTQQQLADAIGISRVALSERLRGLRAFNVDDLVRIAVILDIELITLFPADEAVTA